MAATTMAKTNSLVLKLVKDFPDIHFENGDDFYWSPTSKTIVMGTISSQSDLLTLFHEVAHAVLDHEYFSRDIELLKIEREAWEYVKATLAPRYDIAFDEDHCETMIDSYRDWLHARSTCPLCATSGIQTSDDTYRCLGCNHNWRVNEARHCGLRRYTLKTSQ